LHVDVAVAQEDYSEFMLGSKISISQCLRNMWYYLLTSNKVSACQTTQMISTLTNPQMASYYIATINSLINNIKHDSTRHGYYFISDEASQQIKEV
jgi:hypothetical protein